MTDDLLAYYNRELAYLRRMGAEFAKANPKIAGRLRLGADTVEDPHVSRMVEGVAFLNARVRRKLDDDFPELTDALLGLLYPHYQRPIPSAAIIQFEAQPDLSTGYDLPRGTVIDTEPVDGEPCHFRTCYDTKVWPIEVEAAALTGRPMVAPEIPGLSGAKAAVRIQLRCTGTGMTFAQLAPESLRFYLKGQAQHVFDLYELLLNDLVEVAVARGPDDRSPRRLGPDALRAVGFGRDESLLPYPARSFLGYRLLTEYFTFPRKFLFVDIAAMGEAVTADFGDRMEIYLYLRRTIPDLEHNVEAETFAHGCVPIVNLYKLRAEPIDLDHTQAEYRVVPDARRPHATEVYSVDDVSAIASDGSEAKYLPFYGVNHAMAADDRRRFWYSMRRPGAAADGESQPGNEVYVSVVNLDFAPASPDEWTLDVETTCLNRNLPSRLPFGGGQPRLRFGQGGAPMTRISCLTPPTATLRPSLGHGAFWRLVSHLSLNHLSLDGDDAAAALREILKLYDFRDSAETRAMIEGLTRVSSRSVAARTPGEFGGVSRGTEVTVEFDAERFSGSGLFLFASVLERFLALYSSINSFSTMIATVKGREGVLRRWVPRAGDKTLL